MTERGFDLADRVAARHETDSYHDVAPVDRVAERSYFAPDPGAGLPVLDGSQHLVFAGNNYLGLTQDSRVQDAAARAADTVGTGAGSSRLVAGDTLTHRDLELRLAEVTGMERALAFSSGYAANVGTVAALDPDVVFSDESTHESVVDGCRLTDAETVVYDHRDADDLRRRMADRADGDGTDDESWLVVTDSVFRLDGTVAPLAALCDVVETFGAWLMVDEAHATGLYVDGGGVVQREGLEDRVHVQMGTLSKALASQGGYVAGSETLVEHLVNVAPSFAFSTGLAPPSAAAASEALHLARHGECRDRLWSNVGQLRSGLESLGYEVCGDTQILPVVVGDGQDALALSEAIRDRGIVTHPVRPPTVPEGTSRIRLVPMATHSRADVEACIDAFREAGEAVGLL
ncbi:aminotransferase class I/II-fold pyridoxal phosphate-dependent enzyme [Haloarchaeobius sp. HRN-SO-5]|uniref:aminotransferase class I/II-fold pyridoxal phosphate-dependent enzyme n=1 Tax=Haloarchaeobius sp. HRN-SO-5 TaxID=3446118 RepID=UPI003EBCEC77